MAKVQRALGRSSGAGETRIIVRQEDLLDFVREIQIRLQLGVLSVQFLGVVGELLRRAAPLDGITDGPHQQGVSTWPFTR